MFLDQSEFLDAIMEYHENLDLIRHYDISDLQHFSSISNVSWPTGKGIISKLKSLNLVTENEDGTHASRYRVTNNGVSFGIAIGATRTKLSLVGTSFERIEIDTHPKFRALKTELAQHGVEIINEEDKDHKKTYCCCVTGEAYSDIKLMINNIIKAVMSFFALPTTDSTLLSIGIALPGIIDKKSHILTFSPRIAALSYVYVYDLIDNDLQVLMRQHYVTYGFFHDTIASVLYEKEYLHQPFSKERDQKHEPNLAAIYMGSGLGAGFVLQNSLATRALAEYGHVIAHLPDKYYRGNINEKEKEIYDEYLKLEPCSCGQQHCFENLIRHLVFRANSTEEYIHNTDSEVLKEFAKDEPERYELLKHFILLLLNSIINSLAIDQVVFTGRIFCCISALKKDLEDIKLQSALKQLSVHCRILTGSEELDAVASGAAIMSYHKIFNHDDDVIIRW